MASSAEPPVAENASRTNGSTVSPTEAAELIHLFRMRACMTLNPRFSVSPRRTDFVLASKAFDVVAVIELDDASHRGREDHDCGRDILLERSGYRVMRFKNVPDVEAVQLAVRPPIAADPALRV